MGLDIYLQDEDGEELDHVGDPANILHKLLPYDDNGPTKCLQFIDWYGDTIFNRIQMPHLIEEFTVLLKRVAGTEEKTLLARIIEMAQRCRDDVHLYLKFYGD